MNTSSVTLAVQPRYYGFRRSLEAFTLIILLTWFCASLMCPIHAGADTIPVPQGLNLTEPELEQLRRSGRLPVEILVEGFMGLPYRIDGTVNDQGQYTLFADQGKIFETPGLNCSGLVLELSRFLLRKNINLAGVMRDRLGDSGPGSPQGEDWDFGWDLILNISDGFARRFLLPGNTVMDPSLATGSHPRGFDPHIDATWEELAKRLTPGHMYLVSLNVEGRRRGYGLQHYHVGIIVVVENGGAWFYQTTGKGGGVNRRDLKSVQGQRSFKRAFANSGNNRKMMVVLEVDLPQ